MRWWLGVAAALYPRSWREEFGDEFNRLLDDMKPSWRVLADVLRGAIQMRMTNGNSWLKLVAATAAVGAIVALGLSFRVTPYYEATATIRITPQADPVRQATPEAIREGVLNRMQQMQTSLLSRTGLATVINDPRNLLYKTEQQTRPLEDVMAEMRRHITIQAHPSAGGATAPIALDISFSYRDPAKAREAVRGLATTWVDQTGWINHTRDGVYRDLWKDASMEGLTKTATPPPPVGEIAEVIGQVNAPREVEGHYRFLYLAWGIGIGSMAGLLAALVARWPRRARVLGGFAIAGFVAAAAVSFLLPNRYVSTASMEIQSAGISEDPLALAPVATSAAEFLRQTEPEILSSQSLAALIYDPRLNLYSRDRATKSIEQVVQEMRTKDLRIEPVQAITGGGSVSAFRIAFSYPDRFKAQLTVNRIMATFEELYKGKLKRAEMTRVNRMIAERKAGEALDILDNASLPILPVWPNRWLIASMGLGIGLLMGTLRLYRQRPGTPGSAAVLTEASGKNHSPDLPPSSNQMLVAEPNLL